MKTIVATAALLAALASPLSAQEMLEPTAGQPFARSWQNPAMDFARSDLHQPRPHSPDPRWDVYLTDGTYAGSDPDPFIRNMLATDPPGRND